MKYDGLFFDEYQRYQSVSDIVEYYRTLHHDRIYNILEIGSNKSKHLRKFFPNDNILYTDTDLDEEMQNDPEFQFADGTCLPFQDKSYDFVVATDVLEHVPLEKRAKLLKEALRVVKYVAIITFPHSSDEVKSAEARINAFYKALNGEDYIWLKEHREMGLPRLAEVDEHLNKLGCNFFSVLCGNIVLWEELYYSFFNALSNSIEWEFRKQIDQLYYDDLYYGDFSGSCYRAIYVLSHENIQNLKQYLQNQKTSISQEKLDVLHMLIKAQENIRAQQDMNLLKAELSHKSELVEKLEYRNEVMKEQWKREVQNLENSNQFLLGEKISLQKEIQDLNMQNADLLKQLSRFQEQYHAISEAFFWKITKPFRVILDWAKKIFC